jgi:hypothetical protein
VVLSTIHTFFKNPVYHFSRTWPPKAVLISLSPISHPYPLSALDSEIIPREKLEMITINLPLPLAFHSCPLCFPALLTGGCLVGTVRPQAGVSFIAQGFSAYFHSLPHCTSSKLCKVLGDMGCKVSNYVTVAPHDCWMAVSIFFNWNSTVSSCLGQVQILSL